jgi:hypothetical protein
VRACQWQGKAPSGSAKCRLPDIWTGIGGTSRTATPRYRCFILARFGCPHWLVFGRERDGGRSPLCPVNGHRRRNSSLPKVPEADSANEDRIHRVLGDCVLGSCGRISCTQTCGAQGPPGRAQSRPSCGKSTGLPCSILLIAGNLKPLWRSHWSIRYRQAASA